MKIGFICIHNSCRSQMAEGWANHLNQFDNVNFYSAGTEDYPAPKPMAVEVMEDVGVNMSNNYSKLLTDIPEELDLLITMGCGVKCPHHPAKFREDWGLTDPSGGEKNDFEVTRDLVKVKVIDLLNRIEKGEFK